MTIKQYAKRNNSIIEKVMGGVIKSTISCLECNYKSHTFDTFLTLSVPVMESKKISQPLEII
jgi:ubiquitin C-terminal hydrolase